MRNRLQLLILIALAALVACGGKDKKKTTASAAPTVDTAGPAQDEQEAPDDSATTAADPASLEEVVYFAFDSSDLDETARNRLTENAEWMKEDPTRVLTIEGHTDEVGTSDYNLALGEKRARTTKDYLVRLGVDASRVQIITYGEERPASSSDDALNRRSMFVATKK